MIFSFFLGFVHNSHGNLREVGDHFCVQQLEIPGSGILFKISLAEWYGSIFSGTTCTQKGWYCYIARYSNQMNQNTNKGGLGNTKVLISLSMQWVGGINWFIITADTKETLVSIHNIKTLEVKQCSFWKCPYIPFS